MVDLGDTLGGQKTSIQDNTEQLGAVDATTYFSIPTESVVVRTVNIKVDQRSIAGSNLIWGNDNFGDWNYLWSNTNEATFILGNTTNGVLGQNQLGYGLSNTIRIWESKIWNDYVEDFTGTTYENTSETTAVGWGTGSLMFLLITNDVDFTTGIATSSVVVETNQIYLQ